MNSAAGILNGEVLVLNNLYQALQITSVRRAMCLLYKDLVRVVDGDFATYNFENWSDLPVFQDDDAVHTPRRAIRVPRVILLVDYGRLPRYEVRFTRKNIFHRDRNRCFACRTRARLSAELVVLVDLLSTKRAFERDRHRCVLVG